MAFTFLCMKRTILTIDDELLKQLKLDAARQGITLGGLVDDLLRQALASRFHRKPYKLDLKGWDAKLQPGVDIMDRDKLFDFMNGR